MRIKYKPALYTRTCSYCDAKLEYTLDDIADVILKDREEAVIKCPVCGILLLHENRDRKTNNKKITIKEGNE